MNHPELNGRQPWRRTHSIREQLEHDYWRQTPERAAWMADRQRESTRRSPRRQRRLPWQDRTLLCLAIFLMAALWLRVETAQADPAWGLELDLPGQTRALLALDTAMHVEVTGQAARVQVVQVFRNDGVDWAEGVYRFPLPRGAAVDQLHVEVGERVLTGEIREREEASRVYQQARDDGRAAGLVAQERANQFSTRLANIGPGEEIRVMIGFIAAVDYEGGVFSLRLPMTFTPRFGAEAQPADGRPAVGPRQVAAGLRTDHGLALSVDLLTDVDVAGIVSRYHDVRVAPVTGGYRVTLNGGPHRADRDFELNWRPALGATPRSSLSTWQDGEAVYAQLMVLPPLDETLAGQPREVIFIIDTSGSMRGASLGQAKAALRRGLEGLEPDDRFNLVRFANDSEALFAESAAPDAAHLARARRWIGALEADGGTVMAPALLRALRARTQPGLMRQVVFVTDGSVGNERELLRLIADELGASRLFTVSIGSAPNAWLMRKAAEIGRGRHTAIGSAQDVAERMNLLWESIRRPALSDICLDWGMPAEYYPEIVPDLYAGQPLWVTARLPSLPERVLLCGRLNGSDWSHEAAPAPETGAPALATLWAQRKIEALQDGLLFGADPDRTRAEATQVALDHGLLSPWTSLVAVDRTPARPQHASLGSEEIPSLLPAGSAAQAAAFPRTAAGWRLQLTLSLLVLAVSTALFLNPFFRPPTAWHERRPAPGRRTGRGGGHRRPAGAVDSGQGGPRPGAAGTGLAASAHR
ncbi:MAG: marine proteobacterial sortase target protein [Gammaproteobacteria bacterium]